MREYGFSMTRILPYSRIYYAVMYKKDSKNALWLNQLKIANWL